MADGLEHPPHLALAALVDGDLDEVGREPAHARGRGDPVVELDPAAQRLERRPAHGRITVVSLVPSGRRLYPIGRLDAETTGLILLTDDGPLAHRLTHPSFEVPRTYRAKVRRAPVRGPALEALRSGVQLDDGVTAPARVRRLAPDLVELTIHEGRKRQVRRMLDAVGHPVASLERVSFGPLGLKGLEPGAHRRLTAVEIERLRTAGSRPRRHSR